MKSLRCDDDDENGERDEGEKRHVRVGRNHVRVPALLLLLMPRRERER